MKKTLFLLLLTALLFFTLTAAAEVSLPSSLTAIDASAFEGDSSLKGKVSLPSSVQTVGSRAFAGTKLHALVLPSGCKSVDGSVLANTNAAYLYLNGSTAVNGSLSGVAYVFGPAGSGVSSLSNFYATGTLATSDGFYYSVSNNAALPLCAVDGASVASEITVPKLVNGAPVRTLSKLITNGCTNLTNIRIPAYLSAPSSLSVTPYVTMTATAPSPSDATAYVGKTVTFTTSVDGDYGACSYVWSFTTNGVTQSVTTTSPSVSFTLDTAGTCIPNVTVTDELGDTASTTGAGLTVSSDAPVYRALLVGNTYPGTYLALLGCDNDVAGMKAMLSRMTTTDYRITTKSNLSANQIVSAIKSTFSGATANDVSLFYYAGHGQNATGTSYHGSIVGTGPTYLTVANLKAALDTIPGKKIVILDSCHSGAMIGRSTDSAAGVSKSELSSFNKKVVSAFSQQSRSNLANSGYYVITAAHSTEECVSMGNDADDDGVIDKYFGIFTYSLCQGSGWNMATNRVCSLSADSNDDGEITLHEAFSYARSKALSSNPNQTAQVYPSNSSMVVWAK